MPRPERESLGSGGACGGRLQPTLREERDKEPDSSPPLNQVCSLQPVGRPSATQMAVPFMLGFGSPFISSSQVQTILLQQQCAGEEVKRRLLQLACLNLPLPQSRPSILHQASTLQPQVYSLDRTSTCEVADGVCSTQASGRPPKCASHSTQSRKPSPHRASRNSTSNDCRQSQPEILSALFLNGHCRWPGCDDTFEEYPLFLKHLNSDHSRGDKTIAQWKVQRDMVKHMEHQLILEKQKLQAMQLHLNLSERRAANSRAGSDWSNGLAVSAPPLGGAYGETTGASKEAGGLVQHEYCHVPAPHLLPDIVTGIEYYKYTNIRPPYTYACLIRWSIVEAPDKQRSLNDIYSWFTRMFFYFRHNTATWKNAVRHNLSLHKCFVRVEGGRGSVWTVDETEYQQRKGQKDNRDCTVKWLAPYCPL